MRLNPYPDEDWSDITDFAYRSALSLMRPMGSVTRRRRFDADYVLQRDFLYDYQLDGRETRRGVVPKGLLTDLTSVPVLFRNFVGRVGPWLEAAIIHDHLYVAWQGIPGREARPRDRAFADLMMLRAMEANRVGLVQRTAIYMALRACGNRGYCTRQPSRFVDLDAPNLKPALAFELPVA